MANKKLLFKSIGRVLDAWLPLKIQYARVPGMSVGVLYKGKLVYANGFGWADVEKKRPATAKTQYQIASISKIWTAVAILQLAEQKKLRLSDPVITYVPWIKNNKITIQQLLSHTSGIWRDGNTPHWADMRFPNETKVKKQFSSQAFIFKEGKKFKYSNFGYALLGQVIQEVTGLSYETYMRQQVIEKLHLHHTLPDLPKNTPTHLAIGYSRQLPYQPRSRVKQVPVKAYAPAAGFISNVGDLAQFISNLNSQRQLRKHLTRTRVNIDKDEAYGFGVTISKKRSHVFGHGGGIPGFNTQLVWDDQKDIVVVVLTNAQAGIVQDVAFGILDLVQKGIKTPAPTPRGTIDLHPFEGIYRNNWCDTVVVALKNQLMCFDASTNSPIKDASVLTPIGKNHFRIQTHFLYDAVGEQATFQFKPKQRKASRLLWGPSPMRRVNP